ncbi:linker histone H1 and H5 family-domain-containing protein [Dipodascopsis tothii]|uniref:linker histone H1 and H5 family-domain-containing protein n=1 Tax=Dipodascopsis tothii TaxID=44089 RepID=UPI0034CFCFB4
MPPKKSAASAKGASDHPAYKDMIVEAIVTLKERNGSSRQALKKYIQSNYKIKAANFETQFNAALKRGVVAGDFVQPKGPSGTVKLQKKESKPVEKKPVKKTVVKKAAVKKAAPKKAAVKKAAPKKAAPKKVAAKPAAKATKPKAAGIKKKPVAKKAAPKKKVAPKKK